MGGPGDRSSWNTTSAAQQGQEDYEETQNKTFCKWLVCFTFPLSSLLWLLLGSLKGVTSLLFVVIVYSRWAKPGTTARAHGHLVLSWLNEWEGTSRVFDRARNDVESVEEARVGTLAI